jgi:hypothetical protein
MYAIRFDLFLDHHHANSMKPKLSYLNFDEIDESLFRYFAVVIKEDKAIPVRGREGP